MQVNKIGVPLGLRQGSHNVNMDMFKTSVSSWKGLQRCLQLDVSLNLGLLTVRTRTGPARYITFHVGPDEALCNQVVRCFNDWVGQAMQFVEDVLSHCRWYVGSGASL